MATMRSASSASPITASTCGPGSAFHGSLASRRALVARTRLHVASRARLGAVSAQAAAGVSQAVAPAAAIGAAERGAGPAPLAVVTTTVTAPAHKGATPVG